MKKYRKENAEYYCNYETCRNYPPLVENDITEENFEEEYEEDV